MKTAVFKIDGMNCEGCVNTIKEAVAQAPGVKSVAVSLAERQATVQFDPAATGEDRIAKVIEAPGFRVVGR